MGHGGDVPPIFITWASGLCLLDWQGTGATG